MEVVQAAAAVLGLVEALEASAEGVAVALATVEVVGVPLAEQMVEEEPLAETLEVGAKVVALVVAEVSGASVEEV